MDQPIYDGHWMSIGLSIMLISLFAMCHSVTGAMLADLLVLIRLHCLSQPKALQSVYMLRKTFASFESPLQRFYYCNNCHSPVSKEEICPNTFCSKSLLASSSKSFFLVFPLYHQLRSFFKNQTFVSGLGHRFHRQKKNARNYEDIYDSNVYQQFVVNDGPLSEKHPYNISFTFNTDGVPLFKSSQMSMWPVYLMVNELPFKQRKSKTNMLMYGIWFGSTKPCMSTFCEPLQASLSDLETNGVQVEVNGESVICHCFLIALTADLPAKSSVLNMVQFNGSHSCLFCTQKGKNFRTDKGGNVHIFPYVEEDPSGPARTATDSVRNSLTASSVQPVEGIKGYSFLMNLSSFDYVRSCSVDYMHCVLLGVTKLLLTLWFSSAHAASRFSLLPYVNSVDNLLCSVKPPSNISRLPRSINEHLKYWKAAELRSWLLFYSIPILRGLLPYVYFYHYTCFVEAITLLSMDSISEADVKNGQVLLDYFVYMFADLYGERYLTLNVHSLLHLPSTVQNLGPLWVHSCFPFENLNGNLMSMFHGTQHVDLQIMNAFNMMQLMPLMLSSVKKDSPAYEFLTKLCKNSQHYLQGELTKSCKFIGKGFKKKLCSVHNVALIDFLGAEPKDFMVFKQLKLRGKTFHSKEYVRSLKRNSSAVMFREKENKRRGVINWFCFTQDVNCICEKNHCDDSCKMLACITPYDVDARSIFSSYEDEADNFLGVEPSHVKLVKAQTEHMGVVIIPVKNLISLLIPVVIDDTLFFCEQPNNIEGDL
ncbi:uncharacterized protein LOC124115320 [Haliotis rufescens]|uniref:uncharacterized protein LOC124115320 n=1 Tax=Haliotis rufescens TaxID=6454 RepID=UPI001EAFF775|nr:uncharacterized protein LOC124115320 [Haliotis rufescens]